MTDVEPWFPVHWKPDLLPRSRGTMATTHPEREAPMKRPVITAEVTDTVTGEVLRTERKAAWNSACRSTEAMVRGIARAEGQLYTGAKPTRTAVQNYRHTPGDNYVRAWTGDSTGRRLTATVTVVSA